jgi:hypothetical protein
MTKKEVRDNAKETLKKGREIHGAAVLDFSDPINSYYLALLEDI